MTQTINISTQLVLNDCPSCGVSFGLIENFDQRRRKDKKSFWCPNGHSLSYPGESDEKRIKRLENSLNHQTNVADMKRAELKTEKSAHRRTVGKLGAASKKLKRVDNGVCPECRRSFANVARHMKSQHS